jgi:hypothetical protein
MLPTAVCAAASCYFLRGYGSLPTLCPFFLRARAAHPGGASLLFSIPGVQLQPGDGVFPPHVCVRATAWRCLGMAMQQPDGTFFSPWRRAAGGALPSLFTVLRSLAAA